MANQGKIINELTEAQVSYIAGIIDGEGAICITKKNDNKGMRFGYCYRPAIFINNTCFDLLYWLRDTTRLGAISKAKDNPFPHKPSKMWTIWSRQAEQLLSKVEPFLIVKKKQANVFQEFINASRRNASGRVGLSPEEWANQGRLYLLMKALNQRGLQACEV